MPQSWKYAASLLLCVALAGCSGSAAPALGLVKGQVTVDGQPGADLQVVFEPQSTEGKSEVGMTSAARTDPAGNFELLYNGGPTKGAVVGPHVVRITSITGGGPAGGEAAAAGKPIPPTYNTESKRVETVKAGEQTLAPIAIVTQ